MRLEIDEEEVGLSRQWNRVRWRDCLRVVGLSLLLLLPLAACDQRGERIQEGISSQSGMGASNPVIQHLESVKSTQEPAPLAPSQSVAAVEEPERSEEEGVETPPVSSEATDQPTESVMRSQTEGVESDPIHVQPYREIMGVPVGVEKRLAFEPVLQEEQYWCVPATVQMILRTQGLDAKQAQLAEEMHWIPGYGVHNADGVGVLNEKLFGVRNPAPGAAGYRIQRVADASAETVQLLKQRVRKNIDEGYPMYYTFELRHLVADHGEHNVIGCGYVLTPDGTDIAFLVYYDSYLAHPGFFYVRPTTAVESMLACGEPEYAW